MARKEHRWTRIDRVLLVQLAIRSGLDIYAKELRNFHNGSADIEFVKEVHLEMLHKELLDHTPMCPDAIAITMSYL